MIVRAVLFGIIFTLFFHSLELKAEAPITDCDRYAGHPEDPNAVTEGMDWDLLDGEEGIKICKEALIDFPEESRFYYQLGRSYNKNENYEEALSFLKIAASYDYPMAYWMLGVMAYHEEGNLDYDLKDTINYFKKTLELNLFPQDTKVYLASSYYWNENYSKAKDIYFELEKDQSYNINDQITILLELSDSYFFLQKYNSAVKYYKKIIDKKLTDDLTLDNYAHVLYSISYSLDELERYDEAILAYNKTIELIEKNNISSEDEIFEILQKIYFRSYFNLAIIFENENNFDEAIKLYKKSIEIDPTFANAYNNLARFYTLGQGVNQNFNKANELLLKATDLEDSSLINNMLGLHYQHGEGFNQDFIKARDYFLKSIKEETSLISFLNLGYLYEYGYGVQQSNEEAIRIYKEGVKLFKSKTLSDFIAFNTEQDYEDLLTNIEYLEKESENNKSGKVITNDNLIDLSSCEYLEEQVNAGYDQSNSFETCLNFAEKDNKDAQYYIGYFYENGFVVSKDYNKAAHWYKKSFSQGELYSKYQYSLLILNGHIKDESVDLIKLLEEVENSEIDNEYIKSDSLYHKARSFKYGIRTEKNIDKALFIFNQIINNSGIDEHIINKAIDQSNEIKSIKAGFAVENQILNLFPIELEGSFTWEDDEENIVWSKVKFNSIRVIGPDRFSIKGQYIDYEEDNVIYITLNGLINSKLKTIEIWESNPISSDPDFDPDYDWVTRGSYVGFYNDKLSEINAFWIPKESGPRGALKLYQINKNRNDEITKEPERELNFGDYYAVVIGNNKYDNMDDLETARIDATTVASVLKNKYGFEILKILIDATEKDIISYLNVINKNLNNWDNLLIYYAGHGYLDETDRGYWLPVDANTIESQDSSSWISVDDISNILTRLSPKHILVVADSCYSGSLVLQRGSAKVPELSYNHFKQIISKKTRRALTSGALQPVLDGGGQGHSVFASAFLSILSENNKVIDATSIYNELNTIVTSSAAKYGADQTPLYNIVPRTGDEGGDFIFVPIN